jgi:capsular polysaccharide biosynthesis protein
MSALEAGQKAAKAGGTRHSWRWVQRISQRRYKQFAKLAVAAIVLFASAVYLLHQLLPPVYLAKVTMQVRDWDEADAEAESQHASAFLQEQFGRLQSEAMLAQVAKLLDLVNGGGDQRSLSRDRFIIYLRQFVQPRQVRGMTIELRVFWGDPQAAANIANGIAVVYRDERLEELKAKKEQELQELAAATETHRQRTEKMAAELVEMQSRYGISDPNIDKFDAPVTAENQSADLRRYRDGKWKYLQARREYEAATIRYSTEMLQSGITSAPVRIWEAAEPPETPLLPSYRRFKYGLALRRGP